MFLLIPFFPPSVRRVAVDLVWIRVRRITVHSHATQRELVASHALGNGITINRQESRGCEPVNLPVFYKLPRKRVNFHASPIDYRETREFPVEPQTPNNVNNTF